MRIRYGPDNGQVELLKVRLNQLDMKAEMDPSQTDYLYTRVELDVSFQWHPFATASNIGGAPAPPFDPLGISVQQLRQLLNFPHQVLSVAIGDQLVWEVPGRDRNGFRLPCDVGLGPLVKLLSLKEIEGENLAAGRWRVVFNVYGCSNILLSNRWTVACDTNAAGLTTRTIEGWAICRADAVANLDVDGVDDFRQWYFAPCPLGFRRDFVRVWVNETSTRARYVCRDVQTVNPMGRTGAKIGAVKFTGEATVGSHSAQKSWQDWIKVGRAAWGAASADDPSGPLLNLLQSVLPQNMAMGWCKVTGIQDANKASMVQLAVGVLMDRFGSNSIVGAFVTQGFGESENAEGRWVKVQMYFLPDLGTFAGTIFDPLKASQQMNYANDIQPLVLRQPGGVVTAVAPKFPGDTPPANADDSYASYNLQGGRRPANPATGVPADPSGCRGNWLGELLVQALQTQCEPPESPPVNAAAQAADLI